MPSVTKVTGKVTYRLYRKFTVYDEQGTPTMLTAGADGAAFLVAPGRPSINAVSGETEVVWHVDEETLVRMIEDQEQ